jgi:hypothetical protein
MVKFNPVIAPPIVIAGATWAVQFPLIVAVQLVLVNDIASAFELVVALPNRFALIVASTLVDDATFIPLPNPAIIVFAVTTTLPTPKFKSKTATPPAPFTIVSQTTVIPEVAEKLPPAVTPVVAPFLNEITLIFWLTVTTKLFE